MVEFEVLKGDLVGYWFGEEEERGLGMGVVCELGETELVVLRNEGVIDRIKRSEVMLNRSYEGRVDEWLAERMREVEALGEWGMEEYA